MSVNLVSDRPPSVSLLRIFTMIIFGYIIIGNVVALLVVSLLYSGDFMRAMTDPVAHPDIRNIMVIAQGVASLVGLVLIPIFYLKTFEQRSSRNLFTGIPTWPWILVLAATVVTLSIALSPVTEWNASVQLPSWTGGLGAFLRDFEDRAAELVKAFLAGLTPVRIETGIPESARSHLACRRALLSLPLAVLWFLSPPVYRCCAGVSLLLVW
jgi:hypothetical protein